MKKIISKDFKIGDIILEKGDKIEILTEGGRLKKACQDFIAAADNMLKRESPSNAYGSIMIRQLIHVWDAYLRDVDGFIEGIEEAVRSYK